MGRPTGGGPLVDENRGFGHVLVGEEGMAKCYWVGRENIDWVGRDVDPESDVTDR